MIRDVQSEHLAFEAQLFLSVPFGQVRDLHAETAADLLGFLPQTGKQIKLPGCLVALNANDGFDGLFMLQLQGTPSGAQRVEGATLDQRLDGALVANGLRNLL